MSWTTPRTWVAGEVVTAAEMNTHVRDDLNAIVTGNAPDTSYIRVQGGLAGFINDTNFRIYNLSSPVVVMEKDTQGRLSLNGSGQLSIDAPGAYMLGFYVDGPSSGYEAGWTLTYNGSAIDYTISNGINYGGLGAVQNMGVSAQGMTNFFTSPGTVQISGFQTAGSIAVAGMWAMWLPS